MAECRPCHIQTQCLAGLRFRLGIELRHSRVVVTITFILLVLIVASIVDFSPALAARFDTPDITGRNAIVVDAASGQILYEKQATTRVAPAGLTRLFTTLLALELAPLNRSMEVLPSDVEGTTNSGIQPGESYTLEELIHSMVLEDDLVATMAISRNLGQVNADGSESAVDRFVDIANDRLKTLGLQNTNLENLFGLDQVDHYSSARDVAAATLYAYRSQPGFDAIIDASGRRLHESGVGDVEQSSNTSSSVLGGIVGSSENAGACLVEIVQQDGKTLIAVVLGSTFDALSSDMTILIDFGLSSAANATSVPFGQIAFPDQLPDNPLPDQTSAVQSLRIASNGQTTDVTLKLTNSPELWTKIKWPLIAILVSVVLLVCCGQLTVYRRHQRLSKRNAGRKVAVAPAHGFNAETHDQPSSETVPFQTIQPLITSQRAYSGD